MTTLLDELAQLTNPTPVFKGVEDEFSDDDTNAKIVDKETSYDVDGDNQVSILRRRNVVLLADTDSKYSGKKTSRKKLQKEERVEHSDEDHSAESEQGELSHLLYAKYSDDEDADGEGIDEGRGDEDDDSDSDDLENLSDFKSQLNQIGNNATDFSFVDDGDYSKYADDDINDEDSEGDENDEDDDTDTAIGDTHGENSSGRHDNKIIPQDSVGFQFSQNNLNEEINKGKATKNQLGLWDSLLESRIKLQKVNVITNQLPQPKAWSLFSQLGDKELDAEIKEGQKCLGKLLDALLELQNALLFQNPDMRPVLTGKPSTIDQGDVSDEEIPSDSDEDVRNEQTDVKSPKDDVVEKYCLKRKLSIEEYPDFLAKRHKDFQSVRNNTIQKWNDKTRLASGKMSSKSFSSSDQSVLRQIEQVLADKDRLLKRTQLRRTQYKSLGKNEVNEELVENNSCEELKNGTSLQNYDPEVFDDDDFYHQLLRELIERKSSDLTDPVAISRQWLEIQKLRNKTKKKVDTKASKGRKIRYDVHKKLVNFMAPYDSTTWPDGSKNDLYSSLFGATRSTPQFETDQS